MIARKVIKVEVLLFLVIFAQVSLAASSSKSKSKSTKSKVSSSTSAPPTRQRSGHQYAPPLMLRPSKPDPHFEILDEQRAYYNFGRRLREGRDGSSERKPTKLKEATPTSLSRAKDISPATSFSRKERKEKSRPMPTSSSAESTFIKRSNEGVVSRTKPKFSGSQLLSGDGGPLTHSRRREQVEKDGWKILMGPSVAPEEESKQEKRDDETNSAFTSLTDGVAKHRTITRLRPVKKAKSISASRPDKYFDMNEITEPKKTSKFIDANSRDMSTSTSSRKRSSSPTSSRRTMQVSIPKQNTKHKYAKIIKRVPSKSSNIFTERSEFKRARKSPSPQSESKSIRPSQPIKSSLETRYASLEIENDVSIMSPVMTLDTKKLMIEPIGSSAEPTSFTKVSSMSTEHFSTEQEQEPTIQSQQPPTSFMESRYDRISMPMVGDLSTELVDGNPDEDHHDHNDHFETKTALDSAEYPLVRLSTSMNYHVNHHKDQGGIITSSSFSNLNHDVDTSAQHLPDFPEFSPYSPSHLADTQEPEVKPASFEEAEHMLHSPPPTSPHVEFMGIGTKVPLPPPLHHGPFGKSRLPPPPLHNGRLKSKLPPLHSRFRYPVELPFQPTAHFHGSIAPSQNFMATPGRYPHFPVGSNRHPPPRLHDNLPRPPQTQALSSNLDPMIHGEGPVAAPAHSHLVIHPTPHYPHPHHQYHHRHPPPPPPHFRHGPHHRPPIISPLDVGSGRKAPPPGDFVIEIGPGKVFPGNSPPPPLGVDPDHPAVQHALRNPHQILNDGIYLEPTDSSYDLIF